MDLLRALAGNDRIDAPEIVARLEADLAGAAAVIAHSYEHGHPDPRPQH